MPRGFEWRGYQIAEVHNEGVHIGWGATCGMHSDVGGHLTCKKQITMGKGPSALSSDTCMRLMKQWLTEGHKIAVDDPEGRRRHVLDEKPREYFPMTDAELEAAPLLALV